MANYSQIPLASLLNVGLQLDPTNHEHQLFAQDCPVISNIIHGFGGYWPHEHLPLFNEIIEKCLCPFIAEPSQVEYLHGATVKTDQIEEQNIDQRTPRMENSDLHKKLQFWEVGEWFPHWPKLRACKKYSDYYTEVPDAANCK